MNENQVPNDLGVPTVSNSNVVTSDPVDTGSTPPAPAPAEAPVEDTPVDETIKTETPAESEATPTEPVETPTEEEPTPVPTADYLKRLHEAQQFEAPTEAPDIFDDYGNVDPTKFAAYQAQRDAQVFEKAVNAVNAKAEAQQAELAAWDSVYSNYSEVKDSEVLQNALRGARIQDLSSGGDGDLNRLAKGLVAPFREAKIKATEAVNKTVEEAESLETAKPSAATPPQQAPSLLSQLNAAVANGDQEQAQRIRHAIRKERIYGKTKE